MAEPGRGAPLHAHTTEEIFIALTRAVGHLLGGRRSAQCDPGAVDAVSVPSMRGFRNAGTEDAFMLCILGGGDPPPPIYHLSVTQQVDEWHGRAPARPATQPIPAR